MKAEYNTPKAEKMTFDYKETVVASGKGGSSFCIPMTAYGYSGQTESSNCQRISTHTNGDM